MIGDWVYSSFAKHPCKITHIGSFGYGYIEVGVTGVFGLKDIASLSPIPLTEEFFEKNGFVLDNEFLQLYKIYENKDKRIQVTDITNSGDGYWNVHVDNEDYETIGSCDVKYVHQFHQLLRLCGYEMDVVV
jgi:hypothetical protein